MCILFNKYEEGQYLAVLFITKLKESKKKKYFF